MAIPGALLIGEITHVRKEWASLAPLIYLQVRKVRVSILRSMAALTLIRRNTQRAAEKNSLRTAGAESTIRLRLSTEAMFQHR